MYYRYVDDTFAVFNNEDKCNEFFSHLNSLHPSLRFAFEKECHWTLAFLDVLVEKNDHEFVTIYLQKADFHWTIHSLELFLPHETEYQFDFNFCPQSSSHLFEIYSSNELSNIRSILINNSYPEAAINAVTTKKMNQFRRPTQLGRINAQFIFTYYGWAMFRYSTKCKLKQPSNALTLQLNHALSTPPDNFCL